MTIDPYAERDILESHLFRCGFQTALTLDKSGKWNITAYSNGRKMAEYNGPRKCGRRGPGIGPITRGIRTLVGELGIEPQSPP